VVVQDGGGWWGPGWYADPLVVERTCAVVDTEGVCICQTLNPDGTCARPLVGWVGGRPIYGIGEETLSASSGATSWIAGGLLVGLAIGVYALDKKGPGGSRRASA